MNKFLIDSEQCKLQTIKSFIGLLVRDKAMKVVFDYFQVLMEGRIDGTLVDMTIIFRHNKDEDLFCVCGLVFRKEVFDQGFISLQVPADLIQ